MVKRTGAPASAVLADPGDDLRRLVAPACRFTSRPPRRSSSVGMLRTAKRAEFRGFASLSTLANRARPCSSSPRARTAAPSPARRAPVGRSRRPRAARCPRRPCRNGVVERYRRRGSRRLVQAPQSGDSVARRRERGMVCRQCGQTISMASVESRAIQLERAAAGGWRRRDRRLNRRTGQQGHQAEQDRRRRSPRRGRRGRVFLGVDATALSIWRLEALQHGPACWPGCPRSRTRCRRRFAATSPARARMSSWCGLLRGTSCPFWRAWRGGPCRPWRRRGRCSPGTGELEGRLADGGHRSRRCPTSRRWSAREQGDHGHQRRAGGGRDQSALVGSSRA